MLTLPDRPVTWLFAGDSITQGLFHTHEHRTWFELAFERIRGQLGRLEDMVLNTGVSGWTVANVVRDYDWLIGRFRPDILSLSLGTNDAVVDPARHATPAQVTDRLVELVERTRSLGTDTFVLHTPALISRHAADRRPGFEAYADAVRDAAERTGSHLVDHHAAWLEHWGDAEPIAWLNDDIHPNELGHRAMAATLFDALGLGPYEPRD